MRINLGRICRVAVQGISNSRGKLSTYQQVPAYPPFINPSSGQQIEPVATLADEYGGVSHVVKDDGCYVLMNGSVDEGWAPVHHLYSEAMEVIRFLPPLYAEVDLHNVCRFATQIGSSPYEMWMGFPHTHRLRLLEKISLSPDLANKEWDEIPSTQKIKLKKYMEGESSSDQYDSPLRFAPEIRPTHQFDDKITGGYV